MSLTGYISVRYCHCPKYSFFLYPVTRYLLRFGNEVGNPVHFLLTENIRLDNKVIPCNNTSIIGLLRFHIENVMWTKRMNE